MRLELGFEGLESFAEVRSVALETRNNFVTKRTAYRILCRHRFETELCCRKVHVRVPQANDTREVEKRDNNLVT